MALGQGVTRGRLGGGCGGGGGVTWGVTHGRLGSTSTFLTGFKCWGAGLSLNWD